MKNYFIREKIIHQIREFFLSRNFHEVFPVVLNEAVPTEPNIYPFVTSWNTIAGERPLYLSTSPEKEIKKMLALGIGNCFSIGKCFRNLEGSGNKHSPEYMMLEWYREDATYQLIMQDLQDLIQSLLGKEVIYQEQKINLYGDWPIFSMSELFMKHARLNLEEIINDNMLFQKAKQKGYSVENASWSGVFDQIFVQEIETKMPVSPYFILDFPARLSPLCAVQKNKPYLADRFEFFMGGMEIANGNNENLDYKSIQKSFENEKKTREDHNLQVLPIDSEFIDSIKKMSERGKNYAGIGLGVDRLAMIMADIDDIHLL